MARTNTNQARKKQSGIRPQPRKATVVHDGSAFQLAAELRRYGFQVAEGPLLSGPKRGDEPVELAVIATRADASKNARLREWVREICWHGAPVLAVGAAVGPVAELFGSIGAAVTTSRVGGRLADIESVGRGLFDGLPAQFRLALPGGDRFEHADLSAEFSTTAWSRDGELIGASHVFRPIHLLHAGALDSRETRPAVLANLLRLLRERGGRAF
jgi:hypothetical protein